MKRFLIAGVLFIVASNSAFSQINSGTVVVWMATDNDLVLAADSRVACIGSTCIAENPNRDNDCKILALNRNLIFSSAGAAGDDRKEFRWNAFEIASSLAAGRKFETVESIDTLASDWLKQVQPLVDRSCRTNPLPPDFQPRVMYTSAVFAGVTAKGVIHVAEAFFKMTIGPKNQASCTENPSADSVTPDGSSGGKVHSYGGGAELVEKFLDNPENGEREKPNLRPMSNFTVWTDLARTTYRFAQIAVEQSGSSGDVGGPIDQVHLSTKGIEWLHRKQNCAEN